MSFGERARQAFRKLWDAPFLDWWLVALLASAVYPTIFALSQNWYALSSAKIAWLIAVASIALPLLAYAAVFLLCALLRLASPEGTWPGNIEAALVAVLCSLFPFLLFGGALLASLPNGTVIAGLFVMVAGGLAWLFLRGGQRYFSGVLIALTLVAGLSWIVSFVSYQLSPLARQARAEGLDFSDAKLAVRPNIYFFIYDAYGSRDAYQKVHNFDNEKQYAELEATGFKVIHTLSNYTATWPTTLSFFLGEHHYFDLDSGVDDSKFGRSIMAGLSYNPVLETLRNNGYRIQYIHHDDYFVKDQGVLDFTYPDVAAKSALAVFGNPFIDRMIGVAGAHAEKIDNDKQMKVLLANIRPPSNETGRPWFTFSHVALPAHSSSSRTWQELDYFSESYKKRTIEANAHMSTVVAAIKDRDPDAIIVLIGDHGGWRYRKVWGKGGDPNETMDLAGVDPALVTLDVFGIMIAIYSNGRCDSYVYPAITPVNVMRLIFACLSANPSLLQSRAADISLMRPWKPNLWLTAREGKVLPRWEPFQKGRN
jgi:hypothetical protein